MAAVKNLVKMSTFRAESGLQLPIMGYSLGMLGLNRAS